MKITAHINISDQGKIHHLWLTIISLAWVLTIQSCSEAEQPLRLFTLLDSASTNITFANNLEGQTPLNIIEYMYYLDGGGVATGDINNDGLVDIFFTANELPNRLYLNKGDLKFEDITKSAGIIDIADGWTTGVTMADVNGDGYLDIYVSQLGDYKGVKGVNQLYINNGGQSASVTFSEQAAEYGLDFVGFATQASFFDYDNDGDLDVYLLNHAVHLEKSYQASHIRFESDTLAGDRLLRNDFYGDKPSFVDVTKEAGIYNSYIGYGLAISTGDVNQDGYIDIFISNDFHENDYLYINNQDGTFTETLEQSFRHTSRSSMGNDMADFNNDGLLDIMVLDMLPDDEEILKRSAGEDAMVVYEIKRKLGYYHQLVRNTLQLNRGNSLFSDIAPLAGVYATDWSWSPLICDLDNDGRKDIFITNGIWQRPNDLDYVRFSSAMQQGRPELTVSDSLYKALLDYMPSVKIANFAFKNNGDLTFSDKAAEWGLDQPVWANGAAYADLDNDGDLDLITNNTNQKASIYRNNADSILSNTYLKFTLTGNNKNTRGVGAKVQLWVDGTTMYQEQVPTRGFHSSVSNTILFGTGLNQMVDSVRVTWPGGQHQTLVNLVTNKTINLSQHEATDNFSLPAPDMPLMFKDITDQSTLKFRHRENSSMKNSTELLRPHSLGTQGPKLAVGDVNGDKLDDIFIGGARGQPGALFVQTTNAEFIPSKNPDFEQDFMSEDVDGAFFDADLDGDLDLYVVSGGDETGRNVNLLQDRLYLNNGQGQFTRATGFLPPGINQNGSCVAPADFDGDGDVDLFIGGRSIPGRYGLNPKSYLFENDGNNHFIDVTASKAPFLSNLGMISDAGWSDINGDGLPDLIVVGEWLPVTILLNKNGLFSDVTSAVGLGSTYGWWNTLTIADVDNDGDEDILAGNLGLNAKIKASNKKPASLYINDFDNNGVLDHILCYYHNGFDVPFATRDELVKQLPGLASKFITYKDYGQVKSIHDIFSREQLELAIVKQAQTFTTSYFQNNGDGTFKEITLPIQTQFSPVFAILATDINHDGRKDLLTGGNFGAAGINYGLYDASYGCFLESANDQKFSSIEPYESGWLLKGEVRDIKLVKLANGNSLLIVARNDDTVQVFQTTVTVNSLSSQ